ncbi:hypothetical_protein (plasmid) [Leishmania braziliensis MHOM/BR/75/M2904]|uniref:Hypothetical_protein n=1 Tax=Leishmania braziliensis MHOM/BR/75/M2904 TaxID=420245 RepID=A0A3P3Z742_LEIBR|nr:hypothetical_protein [Leishmania braziliensis MHOM/BR/75/M2904]
MSDNIVLSAVMPNSPLSDSQYVRDFKSVLDSKVVEPTEVNSKRSHVGPHLGSRMHIYEYSVAQNDAFWAKLRGATSIGSRPGRMTTTSSRTTSTNPRDPSL